MTPAAIEQVWMLSLAVLVVVLLVVAALLTLILGTARKIHGGVSAIWTAGQKVANNTVHLAMLDRTNHLAGAILKGAAGVAAATTAIADHAEGCPECPACAIGHATGGAS